MIAKSFMLLSCPEEWIRGPSPTATPEERERRKRDMQNWHEVHVQTFVCDPCEMMLVLPREIDSATWDDWKRQDLQGRTPSTTYPFLIKLGARIDQALAKTPLCSIDFGQIACPYCGRALVPKANLSPKCEQCGGADLELVGYGMASMIGGFPDPWPPIA